MQPRLWKPIVIIAVIAMCALAMYPPSRKLKPGIDLAGGTTLVYTVNVTDEDDATDVIESTIDVLRKRVDPLEQRGLVWRRQGSNRIEIQMALAPKEVLQYRQDFLDARQAFEKMNLSRSEINRIISLTDPDKRANAIADAAGGSELRTDLLRGLYEAKQAVEATREPYELAQEIYQEARQELARIPEKAPDDATEEQKKELEDKRKAQEEKVKDLHAKLIAKTDPYVKARNRYRGAEESLLSTNLPWARLDAALQQPTELKQPGGKVTNPRAEAIKALKDNDAYTDYTAAIDKVVDAWNAYDSVRGPLDDPNDLKALLRGSGVLEFRIAAESTLPDQDTYRDTLRKSGPFVDRGKDYVWVEIDSVEAWADTPAEQNQLISNPVEYFRGRGMVGAEYGGRYYILLGNTPGTAITHSDDGQWKVSGARRSMDERGFPAVGFSLDATGAQLMGRLTGANKQKLMAIVLDDRAMSAPVIQGQIFGSGQISGGRGGFGEEELEYLVNTLNAGALSAKLSPEPVFETTVGGTIAADHLHDGLKASIVALIAVAIFVAIYYFFAGLVADFALAANMVIILGVMAINQATWTLPGIAGIILTIGMAVDANVLIFERIREELENNAKLEAAIRLGYDKALSTILDANITTMIICLILGFTATADIKGFAVTLGIGICATLFTALFCTRAIFEYYVAWFKPKTLKMLPTTVEKIRSMLRPNINWVGMRTKFFAVSAVLIVVGISLVTMRGEEMLDIQFRGGTQVTFDLAAQTTDAAGNVTRKTMSLDDVRSRLDTAAEKLATIAERRVTEAQEDVVDAEAAVTDAEERLASARQALAAARQDSDLSQLEIDRRDRAVEQAELRVESARDELARAKETVELRRAQIEEAASLASESATVQTVGETTGAGADIKASSFSITTLATDASAVSDALKEAFTDVIDIQPKVDFAGVGEGQDAPPLGPDTPVYPVTDRELGKSINRPARDDDVAGYQGKVAIVLNNMTPPVSVADIESRIRTTRFGPLFEQYGSRTVEVRGLDVADDQSRATAGETLYQSAVVLVADDQTDYVQNPDAFDNPKGLAATEWQLVREALQRDVSMSSVNSFSSQMSGLMQRQAIVAIILSLIAIVLYIWIRFGSLRYGLAAIAALVHDVSIALGMVAIAAFLSGTVVGHALGFDPFRIDLAMIAAMMTIIGYSLNDTIVVFDRIRENRGRLATATPGIVNDSINQTISRTILTSGTTLLAVGVLYIFGGPGVHGFAYAMIVGVLIGTYSSVAIASPLLLIGGRGGGAAGAEVTSPSNSPTPANSAAASNAAARAGA